MIHFSFEGKNYVVGMDAYDKDCIILPDFTVLDVYGWTESNPPTPIDMVQSSEFPYAPTPEETAVLVNILKAREV